MLVTHVYEQFSTLLAQGRFREMEFMFYFTSNLPKNHVSKHEQFQPVEVDVVTIKRLFKKAKTTIEFIKQFKHGYNLDNLRRYLVICYKTNGVLTENLLYADLFTGNGMGRIIDSIEMLHPDDTFNLKTVVRLE